MLFAQHAKQLLVKAPAKRSYIVVQHLLVQQSGVPNDPFKEN